MRMLDSPNAEQGPSCLVPRTREGRGQLRFRGYLYYPLTYIRAGEMGDGSSMRRSEGAAHAGGLITRHGQAGVGACPQMS